MKQLSTKTWRDCRDIFQNMHCLRRNDIVGIQNVNQREVENGLVRVIILFELKTLIRHESLRNSFK